MCEILWRKLTLFQPKEWHCDETADFLFIWGFFVHNIKDVIMSLHIYFNISFIINQSIINYYCLIQCWHLGNAIQLLIYFCCYSTVNIFLLWKIMFLLLFLRKSGNVFFYMTKKNTNYFCLVRGLFNQTVKKNSVVIKTRRSLSGLYR